MNHGVIDHGPVAAYAGKHGARFSADLSAVLFNKRAGA